MQLVITQFCKKNSPEVPVKKQAEELILGMSRQEAAAALVQLWERMPLADQRCLLGFAYDMADMGPDNDEAPTKAAPVLAFAG